MITVYRVCKTKYLATAMSGEGARIAGGRWNSPGLRLVYAAGSVSLATLEIMVHLEDYALLMNSYSILPVSFPAKLVEKLKTLPPGWDRPTAGPASRKVGDTWALEGRSAVLAVPSVVIPGETNYILNPAHADFPQIQAGEAIPLKVDRRLIKDPTSSSPA